MSAPNPPSDREPRIGIRLLRRLAWLAFVPLAIAVLVLFGLISLEYHHLQALERAVAAKSSTGADTVALEQALRMRHLRTAAILLLALSVVAVASVVAARRVMGAVQLLADQVGRLGRGEPVQVAVRENSVLMPVQRSIQQAAMHLEQARGDVQHALEQADRDLQERNRRLADVALERSRFLAAVSHDLRQPLYTLTLFASSLRVGEDDPVRLKRIGYIEESVGSLDRLFTELLELSRLETGSLQPHVSEFALDQVFDEVSRNFRMPAETRELRLVVRKTDVWVSTDMTMLTRILNNLVSNALRYTREGGVLVGVRQSQAGQVRIEVWDTGIGIAAEDLPRVFDEFYQVAKDDNNGRAERHGFGLGLATVRRLADLIDCKVRMVSRLGRGSMISLQLERAWPPTIDASTADADEMLDVSGLRVLVVDDEIAIVEGLHALLSDWNCEVRTALDEAAAIACLSDWTAPPDLVISDFHLRDGRNGVQLMEAVAAHYGVSAMTPPFARILVTGEMRREYIREATASNIATLFKPLSAGRLREAMLAAMIASQQDAQQD